MSIDGRARGVAAGGATVVLGVFMAAHFSHHLVTGALTPLLPWLRDELNLDYSGVGVLVSAYSLTYGILQIPSASLGNHMSRRRLIAYGLMGLGGSAGLMVLAGDFWQVAALLVLLGIFGSTYHAPASAFLSQTFDKAHRGRSLGIHTIGGSGSLLITPALAVFIASTFHSWRTSFMVLGVAPVLAGFLVLTAARRQEEVHLRAAAATLGERVAWLTVVRLIGLLVIIAMVASMLATAVSSFLPLYLVDKHGVSAEMAGIMVGLVAGGGVIGAPLGGLLSDRVGRRPVIVASLVLAGPLLYVITALPFGWGMAVAIAAYGLVLSARMPVMESVIADVVPVAQRGTVLGVYFFLSQETAAVATPLVGSMMDDYGADPTFVGLSLVGGVAALLALLIRGARSPQRGATRPA